MARLIESERGVREEPEDKDGPKVLSSEFFSGPRLARRKEVLRGMRGRLHGGRG